ncbi:MAG: prolyl oligopeptidase family serine peptidase [Chlamydiia bacterium]|nr:prolyl oligopeptidase family serine peptidase [Chlamydiia bacterium]
MSDVVCLSAAPGIQLFHKGPALDHGPLPSFFYFALSGPDSLTLDPFNQPVQFLQNRMIRIFSMTLPAHESPLSPKDALRVWAEEYAQGKDPLGTFLDQAEIAVDYAIQQRFVDPEKMAIGGLSRGGFIACHIAARREVFRSIVAFAPLTQLHHAQEFHALRSHPAVLNLSLDTLSKRLVHRRIRMYIGNDDRKVGTETCFAFAMSVVAAAEKQKVRQPQVELFITPSIGHQGHGTSVATFQQGAEWIATNLSQ